MVERELGRSSTTKPIKMKTVKARRKFDETFKRETLNNWLTSGKSAEVIGQESGVTSSRLYAWRNALPPEPPGGGRLRGQSPGRTPNSRPNWRSRGARSVTCGNNVTF